MNANNEPVVAVLGASHKPERYSNRAVRLLKQHHFRVIPIHPVQKEIEGIPVIHSLKKIDLPVNTLTVYVGPERMKDMIDDIITLNPGRVILNPGTESEPLKIALNENKIPFLEACTLVMLQSGQF